jgi:hypothetical protein
MQNDAKEFLTRPEAAEFLSAIGFKISLQTLHCYASRRSGPNIATYWGRRPLYRPADLRAWAESRLRPASTAAA